MNRVNPKLTPGVDRMLQDISQIIGDITEDDIIKINDQLVIDKLKNYYIKYKFFVSSADTEEYELRLPKLPWYKEMIKLISTQTESIKKESMKKSDLKRIIKEEISKVLKESPFNRQDPNATAELADLTKKVKRAQVPWSEAYKLIDASYSYSDYDNLDFLAENGIEIGAGEFEASMQKFGYVLTPKDIQATYGTDKMDLYSLVTNIFYNQPDGLTKLIPMSTLKWITEVIKKDKYIVKNPELIAIPESKKLTRKDGKELFDYINQINS